MKHDPRYPIGKLELRGRLTPAERAEAIAAIAALPNGLYDAVRGLDDAQLDTAYRAGGWTLRQVVHHIADSHINAYARHKLTISEPNATIQAYDERRWAEFADANAPIGASLLLVQALHGRWAHCLASLPERTFARTSTHTEDGVRSLDDFVAIYAWHGRHHVAHITSARRRLGW
ncbi:MAG: putative metal-dependent hydrolase [Planctomycetes bacterium]|nr:putative metal-dependent hydrolase [Planctomycetota bacterium]